MNNINSKKIIHYEPFVPSRQDSMIEHDHSQLYQDFGKDHQQSSYQGKGARQYSNENDSSHFKTGFSTSQPPQVYETADFYPQPISTESSLVSDDQPIMTSEDAVNRRYLLQQQELQIMMEKQRLYEQFNNGSTQDGRQDGDSSYPISPSNMGPQESYSQNQSYVQMQKGKIQYSEYVQEYSIQKERQLQESNQNYDFLTNQEQSSYHHNQNHYQGSEVEDGLEEEETMSLDHEEGQDPFSESLGVQDYQFKENLFTLYQRRVDHSKKLLDQLNVELVKSSNAQDYLTNLRAQLQNNKNNAISQLKIRHHMLVLRLDSLLEEALDQVFTNESHQMERIDSSLKGCQDRISEVQQCLSMVDLKVRKEKKTKFVQYFPDMVKQVDQVLSNQNEHMLEGTVTQLNLPEFNYQIIPKESKSAAPQSAHSELQTLDQTKPIESVKQTPSQKHRPQESQTSRHSNDINTQAKSIRKKLRSLKKETEYAKQLILNEKKLDHLLGALDRSREEIVKKSQNIFEENHCQKPSHKSHRVSESTSTTMSKPPIQGPRVQKSRQSDKHFQLMSHSIERIPTTSSINDVNQKKVPVQSSMRSLDAHQRLSVDAAQLRPTILIDKTNAAMLPPSKLHGRNIEVFTSRSSLNSKRHHSITDTVSQRDSISQNKENLRHYYKEESKPASRVLSHNASYCNITNACGKDSFSQQNTYAGEYFQKIKTKDYSRKRSSKKEKKEKVFRFSMMRMKGDEQRTTGGQIRVYMPFGEPTFSQYYDIQMKPEAQRKVSNFLSKLMRHIKVQSRDRGRFFLSLQTDEEMERILNMDEDIGSLVAHTPKMPLTLFLKETSYV